MSEYEIMSVFALVYPCMKVYVWVCVCLCVSVYVHATYLDVPEEAQEDCYIHGTGDTDSHKSSDMDFRNRTTLLYKGNSS